MDVLFTANMTTLGTTLGANTMEGCVGMGEEGAGESMNDPSMNTINSER